MISIRLGVIFDQKKSFGGGYQQAINAALIAKELNSNKTDVLFFTTFKESQDDLTKYGINAIPTIFVLDSKGVIVAKDLRGEELNSKIASLLGSK